jgi:DNA-binding transcriptional ArsR family regulator
MRTRPRLDEEGIDDLFGVLSNATRRAVLRRLFAADGEVSVADLADEHESGSTRRTASLLHVHLPVLEANGLVTHDRGRGTVRLDPGAARTLDALGPAVPGEP